MSSLEVLSPLTREPLKPGEPFGFRYSGHHFDLSFRFGADGAVSPDAVDGARGLIIAKEAVNTTNEVAQDFIAHRTPGLEELGIKKTPMESIGINVLRKYRPHVYHDDIVDSA